MKHVSKLLALANLVLVCIACSADRTDPEATARAALEALKARDLAALEALSKEGTRRGLAEKQLTGEQLFRGLLRERNEQAVDGWDGQLGEVRYRYRRTKDGTLDFVTALVQFAERDRHVTAVVLLWEDGAWAFHDVQEHPRSDFEGWDQERPQ